MVQKESDELGRFGFGMHSELELRTGHWHGIHEDLLYNAGMR
jgi:hypothetical protein